ncbi:CRISPR-associated helicase Cas3' [Psychrobacter sp. HD31]|uniref:CRISPR-associated helicase Cas3' n=1 Tax=Psychrobacter sp. HD31 TaxID=3112003 RepID=UPI003DA30895
MIVTFISQCEKSALKRTRRVLDAFANRIGDNVWQTAITEEGLNTVKRLLNDTASRSTAVSCHRVRTRHRTELVWIVGRKQKFNEAGVVPVNWTNKEVFMDIEIETKNILANTNGQSLSHHLFAVGFLAVNLLKIMKVDSPKLCQTVFIAGIFHDIGKLDPQFQQWLNDKINKNPQIDELALPELPDDGVHIDSSVRGHTKFTFEKHPRHQEISWLLTKSMLITDELNSEQVEQIFHGIYWHHTKPYRKDDKFFQSAKGIHKLFNKSLKDTTLEKVIIQVDAVLQDVKKISENFADNTITLPKWQCGFSLNKDDLPNYKNYDELAEDIEEFVKDIKPNALNSLVRTAVISADRIVSAMPVEDLNAHINEGTLKQALDSIILEDSTLQTEVNQCLQGFQNRYPNSERNTSQTNASHELVELIEVAEFEDSHNIGVLQGPAGCGKTKIAIEWASKTDAKKIIWVCPRVQVCLGLLNDLTQAEYLPNSKVEIFTGEFKKILSNGQTLDEASDTDESDYFSGDIVITTIDQVINNIISHSKVTAMVTFMQAHVVFDEFHELIPMPAFNLLFAELIEAKKLRKHQANTLLVSATPHNFFVENVLTIDKNSIIRIESFNQADYKIEFISYNDSDKNNPEPNPLIENTITDNKTTFVITNTAQDAQLGFLKHQNTENNILLHSKYTKEDKSKWFNRVFESFKRDGNKNYQVLRSGPIVQASLNISCECMFTDMTSPENWLQRLGRLDRFDDNNHVNTYTTIFPESSENGKQTCSQAKFLASMSVWQSTHAWLNYLKNEIEDNNVLKINDLYQLYQNFYDDPQCNESIQQDMEKALKESLRLILDKIIDPISIPPKSKRKTDSVAKISKNSLRGNNRYVQMAVCNVDSQLNPTFIDEYAYDEDTDHTQVSIGLTESVNKITGYDDSSKNLLAFMHAKHHNIKKDQGVKKAHKDFMLLAESRSPEYPIYVSYTQKDLEPIGGERERHKHAIYYIQTEKQPVGSMQINNLQTQACDSD